MAQKYEPLCCPKCNGQHGQNPCPRRLNIEGQYYRVLPTKEFAKRRRRAYRLMDRDVDNAWADMEKVFIYSPYNPKGNQLLDISAAPYIGRYFVERISHRPRRAAANG